MIIEKYQKYFYHAWGDVLSLENFEYGYIPIPKSASTYLKNYFINNYNFTYNFNYKHLRNKRYIVCLRDPLDRWYSGVAEYFYRFHKDFIVNPSTDIIKFICDRKLFDEHTELQRNFLEGLDTNLITFFYADKELVKNLEHFVTPKFANIKSNNINPQSLFVNSMDWIPEKVSLTQGIKKFISENPKYIDEIKSFYEFDYELIKRVRFYNRKDIEIL